MKTISKLPDMYETEPHRHMRVVWDKVDEIVEHINSNIEQPFLNKLKVEREESYEVNSD